MLEIGLTVLEIGLIGLRIGFKDRSGRGIGLKELGIVLIELGIVLNINNARRTVLARVSGLVFTISFPPAHPRQGRVYTLYGLIF